MISEEAAILNICLEKSVNFSLLKSVKHCCDYNDLVSKDPARHLTVAEFKQVKEYSKKWLENKRKFN